MATIRKQVTALDWFTCRSNLSGAENSRDRSVQGGHVRLISTYPRRPANQDAGLLNLLNSLLQLPNF